jgi:hypothetical protein
LDTLRADNARLRHLLQLSEEQARAAASDQATLTGAPASPVTMGSSSADKVRFFFDLFRCRTDVYALRWENRRDGRSGSIGASRFHVRERVEHHGFLVEIGRHPPAGVVIAERIQADICLAPQVGIKRPLGSAEGKVRRPDSYPCANSP